MCRYWEPTISTDIGTVGVVVVSKAWIGKEAIVTLKEKENARKARSDCYKVVMEEVIDKNP